jgi:putative FmdB family regulatory protein
VPIYEYQCDSCSYRFEIKQSIKDASLTTCERCGKSLRRLISSPGIMFKGSGWYVTDYSDKLKPPSQGEQPAGGGEKKEAPAGSAPAPSTTAPAANTAPASAGSSSSSSPASGSSTTNQSKT